MTQSASGDLNALPVADSLKLIEDLWDSIDAETADQLPLPEWHRDTIDRRLDSLDSGSSIGTAGAEVRKRIVGGS